MARTIRRQSQKLINAIKRRQQRDSSEHASRLSKAVIRLNRSNDAILRGQDGAMRYDKCQTAQIDSEGGYKLDTWSETSFKRNSKEATRKLRQAGRILAMRQLESCEDRDED